MSTAVVPADQDEVAALLADFAANVPDRLDARASRAAKAVLFDSLAVSMGALTHAAAQAARRHASRFPASGGCVIWGSARRTTPDIAALTNGVLLRCYDYNDFFVGRRNSGHPSDMVAGVIVAAEWANASGAQLLSALAVGYEVVAGAFDAFSTAPGGWDYTNLTALGATCAIARVLGLDADHAREALAMTVVPHFASDEIESGDLNRRGDLTMWKRFNGSDAVRNALQACLLAQVGVEGAVRPFVGKQGFIQKLANKSEDSIPVLKERFAAKRALSRIAETYMKRWPVGSLAQSAIQAALEARAKVGDLARRQGAGGGSRVPRAGRERDGRRPRDPGRRQAVSRPSQASLLRRGARRQAHGEHGALRRQRADTEARPLPVVDRKPQERARPHRAPCLAGRIGRRRRQGRVRDVRPRALHPGSLGPWPGMVPGGSA